MAEHSAAPDSSSGGPTGARPDIPRDPLLWRVLVGLYPPSWRARYRDEMLALLADDLASTRPNVTAPRSSPSQGWTARMRTAASLLAGAGSAWTRPRRQLHTPGERVRSSVAVLLSSWVALAACALVFGQVNDVQATRTATPGHPLAGRLFAASALGAHVSVGVLFVCGAPLWLALLRAAVRRRDRRGIVQSAAPALASLLFLILLAEISRLVRHPHAGVGAGWFWVLTVLGVLAGAAAAAGPSLALRRYAPIGFVVNLALCGVLAAVAMMGAAVAAAAADLMTIRAWGAVSIAHAPTMVIAACWTLLAVVLAIATASGIRGVRAAAAR